MNKQKRFFLIAVMVILALLAGCGSEPDVTQTPTVPPTWQSTAAPAGETPSRDA